VLASTWPSWSPIKDTARSSVFSVVPWHGEDGTKGRVDWLGCDGELLVGRRCWSAGTWKVRPVM
jgi:hypothetical protein